MEPDVNESLELLAQEFDRRSYSAAVNEGRTTGPDKKEWRIEASVWRSAARYVRSAIATDPRYTPARLTAIAAID